MIPGSSARRRQSERGIALMATAVGAIALIGAVGLAVDIARMYMAKNESQAFVDAAALGAAVELDGTFSGFERARAYANASLNRWNMGTQSFTGTLVEFARAVDGPWEQNPMSATGYLFTRVTSQAPVSLLFIPVVGTTTLSTVRARAIGAQVEKTTFREGSFPFSPMAHNGSRPHFGLDPGQLYTLRWPSNPRLNVNVCPGDNHPSYIAHSQAGGGEERGFIEEPDSATIREAIEGDYMSRPLAVGDTVSMTGGAKQTQRDSIVNRINQDTDNTSSTYSQYIARGTGNGRRLVAVPINTWNPDYRIVGFAAFFLLPANQYNNGGNSSFCAEYVGPYVQGARQQGGAQAGTYVVRLVE